MITLFILGDAMTPQEAGEILDLLKLLLYVVLAQIVYWAGFAMGRWYQWRLQK